MIGTILTIIVALLIILGGAFSLIASIGLNRLPDPYSRMHSASKAGTLGSGAVLIALALHTDDLATMTRALAGFVFLLLTAPIAAHLLAKAAYEAGYRMWPGSVMDEMGKAPKADDAGVKTDEG
jgi:multicomponent Na+:H+ antiporter subunit G